MSRDARAEPMQGRPSGMLGRWPNQVLIREAGISVGSFGNMLKRLLRKISARFQLGSASRPAISTVPAARKPLSVQFTTIFASEAINELRGPVSGFSIIT